MSGPFGSSQWIYNSGAAVEGQSLRFNDNDSAYLNRTISTTGNRKTWTQSLWLKRGNLSAGTPTNDRFWSSSDNLTGDYLLQFSSGDELELYDQNASFKTNAKYRDPSAWYHIVFALDTTQATSTDRMKLWVNGEQVTSFSASSYPSLNADLNYNRSGWWHAIGAYFVSFPSGGQFFDGYMSEVNFTDGTAYDPTYFGETDDNGQWVPKKNPSVTYGTNGFYLTFDGFNGSTASDESGNNNDWTANNLATTDLMLDHAQNNFSTMNPLASSATLSEGNLRSQYSGSGDYKSAASTMSISSGKWYVELRITLSNVYPGFGIADTTTLVASDPVHTSYLGKTSNGVAYYPNNGFFTNNAIDQSSTVTVSSGDIIGIAIDLDSAQNTYKIYQNGTLAETYNINAPANAYAFCESTYTANSAARADWNFGQDSSFHGLETAQGNQDDNGVGDFYYTPPSGFLALCTDNLPDPAISDGSEHFNTALWTGNGGSSQSITGLGFEPSLTWHKQRNGAQNHLLIDAVRGINKYIKSDTDETEATNATFVTSFDSDGFTIGNNTVNNGSGETNVGWNWKAAGSGSSNTDGSITTTVSANTTAGFSIVSYTGNGVSNATIGHGLSSAPEMVISKVLTGSTGPWYVNHVGLASGKNINLNATSAEFSLTGSGGVGTMGSTTVTLANGSNNNENVNASGRNYITYCFHSVEGYSRCGSYTGNSSSDGPFVYTGFRPAWVMVKASGTASNWFIWDVQRNTYNAATTPLFPNSNIAEEATLYPIDFLSNGFKLRSSSGLGTNESAAYIYMAFAENPFKYSNAR